jgi:hypothetical protein
MKAYRVSEATATLILNLSTIWRQVVNFTYQSIYPRERIPGAHQTGGSMGSRPGLDVSEKRKISCPCPESNTRLSSPYPSNYTDCAGNVKCK